MNTNQVVTENEQFQVENFDDLTEQDIIILWRSFNGPGYGFCAHPGAIRSRTLRSAGTLSGSLLSPKSLTILFA
jgi:hypothetical protein